MKKTTLMRLVFGIGIGIFYYFRMADVIEKAFPRLEGYRLIVAIGLVIGVYVFTYYLVPKTAEEVMENSTEKKIAQDHPVPDEYLSSKPQGFIIGKQGSKYVNIPIKNDPEHMLGFGAPGSGKSNAVKGSFLANYNLVDKKERCQAIMAIDVKPELSHYTVYEDREDIRIINPSIVGKWGFNPFYGLTELSSDDELKSRCALISQTLVQDTGDAKGKYFTENARKILTAALMYGYRLGLSLSESIVNLIRVTPENLISEIVESPDMEKHPKIQDLVRSFVTKTSEGFQDILMTLERDIDIFQIDEVQWCFSDKNTKRVTPHDLVEGISVFLAIPDHKLDEFSPIFRLIIALTMNYLTSIPTCQKSYERPIWILVDEAGSIGAIPNLLDVLARGRSRGIQVTLIAQSFFQLEQTYGNDGAQIILDCCKTTVVLSCSNTQTQQMLSAWCGDYRETRKSTTTQNTGSVIKRADSTNESIEYRPILSVADIKALEGSGKVLVFAKGTWFLVPAFSYYKDRKLKELSEQIAAHNDSLDVNCGDENDHFDEFKK